MMKYGLMWLCTDVVTNEVLFLVAAAASAAVCPYIVAARVNDRLLRCNLRHLNCKCKYNVSVREKVHRFCRNCSIDILYCVGTQRRLVTFRNS